MLLYFKKINCYWIGFLILLSIGQIQAQQSLETVVNDYIQTYQERTEWEKLCSFYSDTLYFKDINLGLENGRHRSL